MLAFVALFSFENLVVDSAPSFPNTGPGYVVVYREKGNIVHYLKHWQSIVIDFLGPLFFLSVFATIILGFPIAVRSWLAQRDKQ